MNAIDASFEGQTSIVAGQTDKGRAQVVSRFYRLVKPDPKCVIAAREIDAFGIKASQAPSCLRRSRLRLQRRPGTMHGRLPGPMYRLPIWTRK